MRWRLYVEEYAPKLEYIKGKLNVLADAFSRLPKFKDGGFVEKTKPPDVTADVMMCQLDEAFRDKCFGVDEDLLWDDLFMYDDCLSNIDDKELINCLKWHTDADIHESYVNLPMSEENPLSLAWLKDAHDRDQNLQLKLTSDPATTIGAPSIRLDSFATSQKTVTGRFA